MGRIEASHDFHPEEEIEEGRDPLRVPPAGDPGAPRARVTAPQPELPPPILPPASSPVFAPPCNVAPPTAADHFILYCGWLIVCDGPTFHPFFTQCFFDAI